MYYQEFLYSFFDNRDILFVATFCVQNMIEPSQFWEALSGINSNCTPSKRSEFIRVNQYSMRNSSNWCNYFALDCFSGKVLDLNKHERHTGDYVPAEN